MSEEAGHDAHAGGGGDHDDEEHGNHEAWVIPYADMLTLLMALFLVLYAMSQLDLRKFEEFAGGLNESLGGGDRSAMVDPLGSGASGMFDGGASMAPAVDTAQAAGTGAEGSGGKSTEGSEERALVEVEASIREAAKRGGFAKDLTIDRDERGLIVAFGADRLLFAPGSDQLGAAGRRALGVFANAVDDLPNPVTVEGHTDSTPISTARFPSNWELSTARATAVLRYLTAAGMPTAQLSAAGYADQRPIAEGDGIEARQANRRVELVIHAPSQAELPEELVVNPGLNPMGG
jgi:chemotaxis protein MotB